MKITRQPNQLILEKKRTSNLIELLFGLPFLLFGCFTLVMGTVDTKLDCERLEPTIVSCALDSSSFILGDETTRIDALRGASMDVNHDSEDGDSYRIMLHTDAGDVPMTSTYGSGYSEKKSDIETIERFVANDAADNSGRFRVEQKGSLGQIAFGGVFALIGATVFFGSLFSKSPRTLIFDKGSQLFGIEYKNTLGSTRSEEYPLSRVKHAFVKEGKDSDGDPTYDVTIVLKGKKEISLGSFGNNDDMVNGINRFIRGR